MPPKFHREDCGKGERKEGHAKSLTGTWSRPRCPAAAPALGHSFYILPHSGKSCCEDTEAVLNNLNLDFLFPPKALTHSIHLVVHVHVFLI